MASKRFRSRRHWHNTRLMLWAAPFILLVGVIFFAATGGVDVLVVLSGATFLAVSVAFVRDLGERGSYRLEGDRLVLEGRSGRAEISLDDVLDVSLIGRTGAREYILSTLQSEGVTGFFVMRKQARRFVRFTSVDIGLTSWTLGLGRSMIDKMPDAAHDLVLLRLRNGEAHLLSPLYAQEMVAAIGRRTVRSRRDQL